MRATSPVSTRPGPISSTCVTPMPSSACTISVKRTGAVTCAESRSRACGAVGIRLGLDVRDDRRLRIGEADREPARRAAARPPAPSAGSERAPRPGAAACARAPSCRAPAAGELHGHHVAGDHRLAWSVEVGRRDDLPRALARVRRRRARPPRGPQPRTAAMAPRPCGTASCMKRPRACTSRIASSKRERAARHQRRVLAETVPCDGDRPRPGCAPRARAAARRSWRGSPAAGARCAAARPRGPRSRARDSGKPSAPSAVLEHGARRRRRLEDVAAHADLLGALPGEEQREHALYSSSVSITARSR